MAIRAKHGDDTSRLVFPLGTWKVARAAGADAASLILRLNTPGDFEVAFGSTKTPAKDKSSRPTALHGCKSVRFCIKPQQELAHIAMQRRICSDCRHRCGPMAPQLFAVTSGDISHD
jgi:hypothetical protein